MIIYVPEDIMERLDDQLKDIPEKIPSVLRKTINNTAKYARKEIVVRRTKERYALKFASRKIKEASEFESAKGKNFQATITIASSQEPLASFNVKKNGKKVSASAKVLQTSQLKNLTISDGGKQLKAFVLKIENTNREGEKSHHVGVFRRMTEAEKGKQQEWYDERAKRGKEQKTTKRNAIKQLYSTSIPQMVKNDKVYPLIEADIKEELRRSLDEHITKVMEGMQ